MAQAIVFCGLCCFVVVRGRLPACLGVVLASLLEPHSQFELQPCVVRLAVDAGGVDFELDLVGVSSRLFWRAAAVQAGLVGALFVVLAVALPHHFFEDWGIVVGPVAWIACSFGTGATKLRDACALPWEPESRRADSSRSWRRSGDGR